ncbi:multidrug transporter subunit MdtD [Pseudopedobacter beijingensis]|uniref:Multidrug transporter subunit MdtD n=1 Tax=Pseudopedobacter beijingensis TaxID=1207056 RepID=A0ABW4IEJ2_9SPHI
MIVKKQRNAAVKVYLPWIAALAFFMQSLDGTILNTALPAIAKDLDQSPLQMQSVIISYTLTLAILIPLSGWLADKIGTKVTFSVAVGLFTLGSLCCALSADINQLIYSRILQGTGGAMMVPVARLTILYAYPKKLLLKVLNFVIIPGMIGPLIGPSLGGWIVDLASWHWIFLINIPIGIFGIVMAIYAMPNFKKQTGSFDLLGFVFFSGALTLITHAMEMSSSRQIQGYYVLISLLVAASLIFCYIKHARRHKNPLIRLELFKIRTLRIGLIGSLATRLGIGGFPLLLPLMLQVGFGYSATISGMMLIPSAAANLFAKPFVTKVVRKLGYKKVLVSNTFLLAVIIALFSLPNQQTPIYFLIPLLLAYGMVSSMQFSTMNTISVADLDADNSSEGNSMIAVTQQLSISFGISITSLLLGAMHQVHFKTDASINVFKYTFLILGIITALSSLVFSRLKETDGNNLSGHRELES